MASWALVELLVQACGLARPVSYTGVHVQGDPGSCGATGDGEAAWHPLGCSTRLAVAGHGRAWSAYRAAEVGVQ